MPKIKTSKSAVKRIVKITRRGKILRRAMSAQHRNKGKSNRTKSQVSKNIDIVKANIKKIKKLIPYS